MFKKSLNDRHKSGRTSVYQRGNQRDASPHYVFLYSDDEYSEDEENIPLQNRNHAHAPRKVEVIKIEVQSEDTLQALALRYGCTISEIKRVNNIHKENEIFARQVIKVPVQPFSLLTENLNNEEIKEPEKSSTSKEEQILNLITTPLKVVSNSEINNIILNSVIEPISQTDINEEENINSTLLSPSERKISQEHRVNRTFKCSGADWGFRWFHVIGISLLIWIGVPIYIFYVMKQHSIENPPKTNKS
ncbi:lysM and putative peptidoglycan-binding domain-containing protein 3 isoform X1 [Leptopilina heterotoma]|uniref:lysM and putative peptidoglycan-binding domain-containing protein 3 isoform X1 n=1 Tax=Leptopilina heterotoma TaxID=63436 RepID=UPI001CA8D49E|nr:lysM and putative peptidoglycan-binding domain-containing protein 3 isoform X1 [Leptopilina heterotoma]